MSYIIKVDVSVKDYKKFFYVKVTEYENLHSFKPQVEACSNNKVNFTSSKLRMYWIDSEQDEISVFTWEDFEVFLKKSKKIYIRDED